MPFVVAAFLAQVLTAGVGDRAELRHVVDAEDNRLEFENRAVVSAGLQLPALELTLSYSPSILVTPLESPDREASITHDLTGRVQTGSGIRLYRSRTTTVVLVSGVSYTQSNVRRQVLGAPPPETTGAAPESPGTDTPPDDGGATDAGDGTNADAGPSPRETPTTQSQARADDITTHIGAAHVGIVGVHLLSRKATLQEDAGYAVSGGLGRASHRLYPVTHGPVAGVAHAYRLAPRDLLVSALRGQWTIAPESRTQAWAATYTEALEHRFTRRTTGELGAGMSYAHVRIPEAPDTSAVYPTARAAISHVTRVARGKTDLKLEVGYAPVLDATALRFDPRFNTTGTAQWVRRRLSLYAQLNGVLSAAPDDEGALSAVTASLGARYELGAGFAAEGGWRFAWQTYNAPAGSSTSGTTGLRPVGVTFVALTWSHELL